MRWPPRGGAGALGLDTDAWPGDASGTRPPGMTSRCPEGSATNSPGAPRQGSKVAVGVPHSRPHCAAVPQSHGPTPAEPAEPRLARGAIGRDLEVAADRLDALAFFYPVHEFATIVRSAGRLIDELAEEENDR